MRTLIIVLCLTLSSLVCGTVSAGCKDCDGVVVVSPFARVVVVRRSDTVVVVDRPLLWPLRSRVIVVRGK